MWRTADRHSESCRAGDPNERPHPPVNRTLHVACMQNACGKLLRCGSRRELLEHLSLVSTEIALPPEKRKMGPLKSSIAFLREGIADVAKLAAIWPEAEKILKALGILSH